LHYGYGEQIDLYRMYCRVLHNESSSSIDIIDVDVSYIKVSPDVPPIFLAANRPINVTHRPLLSAKLQLSTSIHKLVTSGRLA